MTRRLKIVITLILVALKTTAYSQEKVQMADTLRTEGKIYVVVAIILIILIGLIFYLFLMDRKVDKLEKLISARKKQTN
jgi:K+-transporting ATPase A subunit